MSNEMFYMIMGPIVIGLFIFAAIVDMGFQLLKDKTVDDYLNKPKKKRHLKQS